MAKKPVQREHWEDENNISWLSGARTVEVDFTNAKHIKRIKEIMADPESRAQIKDYYENEDGSVYCVIPLKWIKINPGRKNKRVLTDEQKAALAERMKKARETRKKK